MSHREPLGWTVPDAGPSGPVSDPVRNPRGRAVPLPDRLDSPGLRTALLTRTAAGTSKAPPEPSRASARQRSGSFNRPLIITLLVSLGLHAASVTAAWLLLRTPVPVAALAPDPPAEVQLVMEEHKGDLGPTRQPAASQPSPPAPQDQTPPPQPPAEAKATAPAAVQPTPATEPAAASEQQPGPAPETADKVTADASPEPQTTPEATPAPPAASPAPVISLQGTDSPSDARAFGDHIIPAKPDAVFHNRPPEYPEEAAQNGQQGTVVVLIHVSPTGTAASVDLIRSSGYVPLDRAAQLAVSRWRFLPAVKDGQPVASDMTMGFIFDDSDGGVHGAD